MRTTSPVCAGFCLQIALGVVALIHITGCSPSTQFRRSALVPAASLVEWDGRTAPRGSLRVEGAVSAVGVERNVLPQPGDAALHVPTVMLHGAAAIAATNGLELGARYSYGAYDWSSESAEGTVPIRSGGATWGLGPELRGTIRFGKEGAFALGLVANYLFYSVPVAEWERDSSCIRLTTPSCYTDAFTTSGETGYRLRNQDTKSTAALAFGIYPSFAPVGGKYGHVFAGIGAHSGFKNDGFSNNVNGAVLEGAGLIFLVGVGYGIKIDMFRAAAMLDFPLTNVDSPVNYTTLGGFVTIGVDIPVFGAHEARTDVSPAPPAPP